MSIVAGTKTLQNLITAYDGERNAAARYALFAKTAEEDGFLRVAGLFRAATRAEQIHATNHAEMIRKMGGTPASTLVPPTVGSTRQNLKAAMEGEEHERDVMYPEFIRVAHQEKCTQAIWTLDVARQAEAEHARLYREALENLDEQKTRTKFYVCLECGYTTEKAEFDECPVCSNPLDRFEVID
jgi:rubrerythrin